MSDVEAPAPKVSPSPSAYSRRVSSQSAALVAYPGGVVVLQYTTPVPAPKLSPSAST